MQTRALHTLLAIRQLGGFAAVAEARNMTLSAVSMQIKALEADLGVTLFDRSHRPPQLTPLGRQICDKAEYMAQTEREIRALATPQTELRGQFRIGFVPTASVRLLPNFLIQSERRAPAARFEIETDLSASLEARVRSGALDAAVITAEIQTQSDLTLQSLRVEPLVYVAPSDMAKTSLKKLFVQSRFFHFMPASGIGKLIAKEVGKRASDVVVLDSVEAIVGCVARGLGFTLLPLPDIQRFDDGRLSVLKSEPCPVTRELALITRGNDALIRQLGKLFEDTPSF